jgi:hypothetical protein
MKVSRKVMEKRIASWSLIGAVVFCAGIILTEMGLVLLGGLILVVSSDRLQHLNKVQ